MALSRVEILHLESMKRAMTPPCMADRSSALTAGDIANVEAIRNRGVPVAVALPDTMELPTGMSLEAYLSQLMEVRK